MADRDQDADTITVTRAEWEALQRDRLLHDTEREVVRRVKQHFAWVAIIVAGIGLIGVQALGHYLISTQLSPQIENARTAAAKADAEASLASEVIGEMRESAQQARQDAQDALKKAQNESGKAERLINAIDDRIQAVDRKLSTIEANAENVRTQYQTSFKTLDTRLNQLAEAVPQAAMEQRSLRKAAESELEQLKENSAYQIHVTVLGETQPDIEKKLIGLFRNEGFKVSESSGPFAWAYAPDAQGRRTTDQTAKTQFQSNFFDDTPVVDDRVHILYSEKGKQKVRKIQQLIADNTTLSVRMRAEPDGKFVVGDIQIVFGNQTYWDRLAARQ